MKCFFTILIFLSFYCASGQTANMDFEQGSFNNWNIVVGLRTSSTAENYSGNQGDLNDHIQIMNPSSPQFDVDGQTCTPPLNMTSVFPGGIFSAKIGNLQGGRRAAKIFRTFTVTAAESYLLYSYAIVMQDPNHSQASQPKFVVNIKDSSGALVPCGQFEAFAGPNALSQGFFSCGPGFGNVQILPWVSGGADLSPYVGQQITIEFIALDCMLGGHGGLAYVDATVEALEVQVSGLCPPQDDITLTAPLGFTSYEWHLGDINGPIVGGNSQTIPIIDAVFGDTYTVILTSNTGCNTTATVTLGPVDPVIMDPIPDQEICAGGFAIITPTGTNVSSYLFDDGTIGNATVVSPLTDTTYTVTALDENGCPGPSETVVITVLPSTGPPFPDADFTMDPVLTDPNNPCNTIQFNNLSDYCRSDLTYEWDFGDGSPISTEQNPIHTFPTSTTFQIFYITLTVTSQTDGLIDTMTSTFTASTINPSFYLTEDCGVVTVNNVSTICGETFDLFPSFTYSWDFGDGFAPVVTDSTQAQFDYTYAVSGQYTVTLTMIDGNGTSLPPIDRIVNVVASPTADFDFFLDCYEVQFIDQSVFCDPITSYLWDFGDGTTSTNASPIHDYFATGVGPYTVTLEVSDGVTTLQHSLSVLLDPAAVTAEFLFTTVCNVVTFQDLSNSCVPLTYQWNFDDGSTVSTDENPIHIFAYNGVTSNDAIYNVELTINDGTQDYTIIKPVTITSEFLYNKPLDLIGCGDDTNFDATSFDLIAQANYILSNVNLGFPFYPLLTFHLNQQDADNNTDPLPFDYTNITNPQIIVARVEDSMGCYQTFPFQLEVFIAPTLDVIDDINFCRIMESSFLYDLLQVNALIFEGIDQLDANISFHLSESAAELAQNSITNINLTAGVDYIIYIRAENANAPLCFDIEFFNIRMDNELTDINDRCIPFFANTMTPNDDGANDTFYIDNIDTYPNNHLTIYNRWGEIVYETVSYVNQWDGTYKGRELPVATYYYVMELNDPKNLKHAGYISILR